MQEEITKKFVAILEELRRLFLLLNEHYFESELPEPVIAIQSNDAINSRVKGWFRQGCWYDVKDNNHYCEITICGEFMYEEPVTIVETLLHEMCHHYNKVNGIKDTSRSGFYHNKKFKAAAESHGLNCTSAKPNGFHVTTLTDEARSFIMDHINLEPFGLARVKEVPDENEENGEETKKRKKKAKYVYRCNNCEISFTLKQELSLMCATCKEVLECVRDGGDED